jgi:hypothetical protein
VIRSQKHAAVLTVRNYTQEEIMENKLASVFHPTKSAGADEAARLKAAHYAATTNRERAELLREAKVRVLMRQLLDQPEDEEADAA